MLSEETLRGIIVPVVTPLNREGKLDTQSFHNLISRLKNTGIHGLIVNASLGEGSTPGDNDIELMIDIAKTLVEDKSIIVEIGFDHTLGALKRTVRAKWLGADAVLISPPFYKRYSQEEIINQFYRLTETNLPIILLDILNRKRKPMDLTAVKTVVNMDHVIGLVEGTNDIKRLFNLVRDLSKPVLCGVDELLFASLCFGVKGASIASAQLETDDFVKIYNLFREGEFNKSSTLFERLTPLIQFLSSEASSDPLKWLLNQHGYIQTD
ncbi:dihydrodipicolinate synthase family protein [Paenibacillus polysaccharolyticus]|uniref:dihydrodipicolinate synthase family protein n=1 Tax=Paenibacillus polysaccharolyticus TaxID=582692 RepID=UPI00209E6F76|nr:dihydrodipicolinate synthase family protein [Paenibacillus polysaccharolyticus]MCP1136185.1 dihydrodipicolinate synthase family protein [Paenibacillus polysaccharolyticus]